MRAAMTSLVTTLTLIGLATIPAISHAADIFVREAHGSGLSKAQSQRVTDLVKNAVRGMPEHNLVLSETSAEYTLDPVIVSGENNQQRLRLRALHGQNLVASSEQALTNSTFNEEPFTTATRSTIQGLETAENTDSTNSKIGSRSVPSSPDHNVGSDESMSGATSSIDENRPSDQGLSNDETSSGTTTPSATGTRDENRNSSINATGNDAISGGETRGTAPRSMNRAGRGGYFSVGAGPSFPIGLNSNNVQYGITGAYNADFNERIGGKLFGNLNLGSGSDSSRFINAGAGANLYFPEATVAGARPYLTADIGYGSARRNETEATRDAPTVGAGAGFQFAAQEMNLDVILHYSLMTADLDGATPSVLALQLAVNF